jgi:hypothetical protein
MFRLTSAPNLVSERSMETANIPPEWLALTGTLSPEHLLELRGEVIKRGIAETDLPAVKAVWIELNARRTATS